MINLWVERAFLSSCRETLVVGVNESRSVEYSRKREWSGLSRDTLAEGPIVCAFYSSDYATALQRLS